MIYDLVIRLVQQVGCDALRLFVKPEPMRVARDGDELIVLDQETGDRIGRIDSHGGGALGAGSEAGAGRVVGGIPRQAGSAALRVHR